MHRAHGECPGRLPEPMSSQQAEEHGSEASDSRLRPSGYELLAGVFHQFSLLLNSARYLGFRGIRVMADACR